MKSNISYCQQTPLPNISGDDTPRSSAQIDSPHEVHSIDPSTYIFLTHFCLTDFVCIFFSLNISLLQTTSALNTDPTPAKEVTEITRLVSLNPYMKVIDSITKPKHCRRNLLVSPVPQFPGTKKYQHTAMAPQRAERCFSILRIQK